MTRFYPVYVRRSDGRANTVARGKREEPNQPTSEQMDQKPDKNGVSDFYREVQPDEAKHVDWRRKLGGMLARELQRKDNDVGHILVAFPEHYKLFEHIKKSEKDGKTEVKSKTHAAGGNDRQDAYLYGHPDGRRKRYRSPADFFPHLLWLCTDESGDPDNCSCKLCCAEELDSIMPVKKPEPEKKKLPPQQTQQTQLPQPPQPTQVTQAPQAVFQPTPLPQIRSLDQRIDSQYNSFKYRPGELCWFRRDAAWGLGVILRRWENRGHNYTVQPLSPPYIQLESVVKSSDEDMRPWLAWSVPKFTSAGLNELEEPARYDTVDWHGLLHNRFGSGNLEVDGSILAAKSIDSSYTPFEHGIYIGGEKIWLGEAVRLAFGSGTDILIIHSIEEAVLVGDIYTLTAVSHPDPSKPTPASPANNPHLPIRLTEDLAVRNAYSISQRKIASYWKLTAVQQRIGLDQVKGRWYETSIWLPVLQPQAYTAMVGQGNIQELSLFMNARGDCLQANREDRQPKAQKVNIRRLTRLDALGHAVPRDAQIIDGVEMPAMLDPQFEQQTADDGAVDQFMNLDAVEGQPGFDQGYQRY